MFDYSDMITRPALFDMLQWLSTEAGCALVAAATVRHVPAGGTIYDQLEEGDEMFRLVSGSVRLSVLCEEGRELLSSEEHTSELQSLMRNSYAVFCLKTNKQQDTKIYS